MKFYGDKELKRYIYGAGKYGHLLYDILSNYGIEISGFVVSFNDDLKLDSKTMLIDDCSYEDTDVIYIAVKDEKERRIIRKNLNIKGLRNDQIIDFGSFIKQNDYEKIYSKYCLLCGSRIKDFEEGGWTDSPLFYEKHIIGGGKRSNCICPVCKCNDRMRWVYYTICKHTDMLKEKCRVLYFAPEKQIVDTLFLEEKGMVFYGADISSRRGNIQVDMTNICFKNDYFDYVVANHVLEHIQDETAALREVYRVLSPGGKFIFSFPICTDCETFDDESIVSKEDRLRFYGQEDHVRLYGTDYLKRIESVCDLKIQCFSPQDDLPHEKILEYGFIKDDIVMIGRK